MTSSLDRAYELLANVPGETIDRRVSRLISDREILQATISRLTEENERLRAELEARNGH